MARLDSSPSPSFSCVTFRGALQARTARGFTSGRDPELALLHRQAITVAPLARAGASGRARAALEIKARRSTW